MTKLAAAQHPLRKRAARFGMFATLAGLLLAGCAASEDEQELALDPFTVTRSETSNDYLVCPPERCAGLADRHAPVIATDVNLLKNAFVRALGQEPRMTITRDSDDWLEAEQSSAFFGFVDDIAVRIVADQAGATFAIYSRSRVGRYDFGVNKERVERIIENATKPE